MSEILLSVKLVSIRKLYIVILSGAKNLPEKQETKDSSSSHLGGTPQNNNPKQKFSPGHETI
jgi:hypothetical protein